MTRMIRFLALAATVAGIPAAAASVSAQTPMAAQAAPAAPDLLQRSFVYLGHDLRVTVAGEAAGAIQVLRGDAGRIDLSARGFGGPTTAGLASGSRDELTLASAGANRVEYVLTVPRDARVTIRLPGQPGVTMGALARTGTWSWPAPEPARSEPLPIR